MTRQQKNVVSRAILFVIALVVCTFTFGRPADVRSMQAEPESAWRQVHARQQRLTMMVPYHWRLTLNERSPGFLSATAIDESGRVLPTHLNIRFAIREDGAEYPLPDPDAYAAVLLASMRTNELLENVELIEAATVDRAGLTGTLVEFTFLANGVESRARSLNLIATQPPRRYIVSYGTVDAQWDQEIEELDAMIDSIEIE